MMNWVGKALQLPEEMLFSPTSNGGGVIQGTASEASLTCMLAARNNILKDGRGKLDTSKLPKLVAYTSSQSHSSIEKAAVLAAVTLRAVDVDQYHAMRGDTLENAIQADLKAGLMPFFLVVTLGTTNTCAFDNIIECGKVCK